MVVVDRAEPGIPFVTSASVWTPVGSARRRSTCSRRHRRTPSAFVLRCRSRSRARGRITKQGSRRVRWAAVESVKALGPTSVVGAYKKQVGDRRGKNIGTVAAARRRVEFVFYALRDHHVRALHRRRGKQRHETPSHEIPRFRRLAARPCRSRGVAARRSGRRRTFRTFPHQRDEFRPRQLPTTDTKGTSPPGLPPRFWVRAVRAPTRRSAADD